MKNIGGLIVPVLMILLGAYVLLATLTSGGEQVRLIGREIPRNLALVFVLIGVGGGVVVLLSSLSDRKLTARKE